MSIIVNETYIKTNACGDPEVIIGNEYLSMDDFCDIVRYVMTNTDLKGQADPRHELKDDFLNMKIVSGYNKGNFRFEVDYSQDNTNGMNDYGESDSSMGTLYSDNPLLKK
jgi:hypothetical protein